MLTRTELTALIALYPEVIKPLTLTLACGHSVLNEAGTFVYNYYDQKWEVITKPVSDPDIDTSGQLPLGITYWMTSVDCSRACCVSCGEKEEANNMRYR